MSFRFCCCCCSCPHCSAKHMSVTTHTPVTLSAHTQTHNTHRVDNQHVESYNKHSSIVHTPIVATHSTHQCRQSHTETLCCHQPHVQHNHPPTLLRRSARHKPTVVCACMCVPPSACPTCTYGIRHLALLPHAGKGTLPVATQGPYYV